MAILAVFAGAALVLATVGIYGVIAFTVTLRTHEIGIRVALGAMRSDILRVVLRQALVLALSGIAIGAAASVALTPSVDTQNRQLVDTSKPAIN